MRLKVIRPVAMLMSAFALLAAGASGAFAHGFFFGHHHHQHPLPPPPPPPPPSTFTNAVFFNGASLSHQTPHGSETLTNPDDISYGTATSSPVSRTASGRRARRARPATSTAPSSSSREAARPPRSGTSSASATA